MTAIDWVVADLREQALTVGIPQQCADLAANFAYVQQERFLTEAIDWLKTQPAVTLAGKNGGYELLTGFLSHRGEP